MDKTLFTQNKTGSLVQIDVGGQQDWAFIPDPLPEHWEISRDLWPLLLSAHKELARLDGVGKHMPNHELLLRPLQQREAIRSSSLEGTYATPKELLLFQMDPREPKSTTDPANAWKEVANYASALKLGQDLLKELPISLRFIRQIHEKLLTGVRGHQRDPGNFRRSQVHIGSDRRFVPPPFVEINRCLDELEKYIHKKTDIDPLLFCFMVHYQFETIHPFLDGNGRVGRLLLALMIFEACGLTTPWLYLSAYFDRYKDEYINHLFNISANGDWETWFAYCLRGTLAQASDAIRRLDSLLDLKSNYQQSIVDGGGSSIRLTRTIEKLFEFPLINVPNLAREHSITYPTAKADIDFLISIGILSEMETNRRPKAYVAMEVLKIAYSEPDEVEKREK